MIVETTHIFELSKFDIPVDMRRNLTKKFGSKRSGTIYIVASNQAEAKEVAREMFKLAGYEPPRYIDVTQSWHIKDALRAIA